MDQNEILQYQQYVKETGQRDPEMEEYIQYIQDTTGRAPASAEVTTAQPQPFKAFPDVQRGVSATETRLQDVLQQSKPGMYGPPLPPTLPEEEALASATLGAATGQMPSTPAAQTITQPVKAAGRKVSQLGDYLLGKLAGLTPKEQKIYQQAPDLVQGFAKELQQGSKANISSKMSEELTTANEAIRNIGLDLDAQTRQALRGKMVKPKDYLRGISREADQALSQQDLITGSHPAEAIHEAKKVFQQEAKFKPAELATEGATARKEAAGKAAGELKRELESIAPEIKDINKANQDLIKLQEKLVKGSKKPRAFVKNEGNAEVLEQIDKTVGTRLTDMSNAYKAAQKLANPRGLKEWLGGVGLKGSEKLQRGTSKAATVLTKGALRGAQAKSAGTNTKREK